MFSGIKPMNSKNFLTIKKLSDKINFGFFKSKGGVSKKSFYSLNCSKSVGDNIKNVEKNIKIALNDLLISNKKIKLINQVHSNKIFLISKNNLNKKFFGDGLVTSDKNIAIGVLTADCAPIFLFDIKKNLICCLHAGWKGALTNICRKGLETFINKKIKKKDIIVIIGPCLGFKNFEVDKEFKLKFIKKDPAYFKFFKNKNKNKDIFDLRGLLNFQINAEGIKNIYNIRKDTYKHSRDFFSHRRITHQKKSKTGRMINIISF